MKRNSSLLTAALGAGLVVGVSFFFRKRKKKEEKKPDLTQTQVQNGQELAAQMPDLIRDDWFVLVVQPVVDLETGAIVGGEVLCRLNHPEQGMIFPDKFIPALEDAGLLTEFDYYIYGKVCDLMSRLMAQGMDLQYLSCNFSRLTLSEAEMAERLTGIADSFHVPHDRLAVEITEQDPESNLEQFCQNLRELKDAGFRIFVDDLGAGITSAWDLWSYPVDVVKIDRSMLLAAESKHGRIAYQGLRNLAAKFGHKVLCEGVETEEHRRFVLDVGCNYCQGFLFYRPMAEAQFIQLINERSQ